MIVSVRENGVEVFSYDTDKIAENLAPADSERRRISIGVQEALMFLVTEAHRPSPTVIIAEDA